MIIIVPGFGWWVILGVIVVMAWNRHAQARQRAMLAMLTVAAERSIPLGPAIEAMAAEQRGRAARRARRLAAFVTHGASLSDAVARTPGAVPPEALPLVCVGCETGDLAAALRQAAAARQICEPLWQYLMPRILYICFVLWFASVAVTFLILNIVPKLEKIFRDFGTGLPEATLWVIGVTRQLGHLGVLVALVPMAALGLLVYAVLRYAGVIRWDPPGIARLVRRLDAAAILDVLALAVAHEQPIDQAIDSLCWSYPRRAVRNRLASVLGDIREGTDWRESLHRRGLIGRAELAVLRAAQQAGNLPWAMRELADSGRRRFAYRVTALLQLLVPVMILGLGAMVFAVVVAFFLPLVHLIQTLAVP